MPETMSRNRALHFVLKVGNLKKNLEFFRDKLGMSVLRHEVFEQGCDAACNGPYDGKWSKTMIGYGPEDDHFVLELTYNYSVGRYELGNDLQYIKLGLHKDSYHTLTDQKDMKEFELFSPDGYKFIATNLSSEEKQNVTEVCLSSTDLSKTKNYWSDLLKMHNIKIDDGSKSELLFNFDKTRKQADLRFKLIEGKLDHKAAYGRIAFSCPSDDLKPIQKRAEDAKVKILTPYLSLDTPGKATVVVVILADTDGHEICFVGDEGYRELSKLDPDANDLIEKSIAEDKSDEWYKKKNRTKKQS